MFTVYPSYPRYRALRLLGPRLRGEDVHALQTALDALGGIPGDFDGILGPQTAHAIAEIQKEIGVLDDGICGPRTWEAIGNTIALGARDRHRIAPGLMYGQLAHESGFFGGNYSPQRPNGSYDAGIAQRNTEHTSPLEGFNVPRSIEALARNTRAYFDAFAGVVDGRRWKLAAGAWNAPAFAGYLANEEGARVPKERTARPSDAARRTFETYMDSVSAYLRRST